MDRESRVRLVAEPMVAELEGGHMDVSQLYTLRAIYRLVRAFAWFVLLMLLAAIAGGVAGALGLDASLSDGGDSAAQVAGVATFALVIAAVVTLVWGLTAASTEYVIASKRLSDRAGP